MARSYAAHDIIQLPVLGADAAVALGAEILLAAKEQKLPALVKKRAAKLEAAHDDLRAASKAALPDRARSPEAKAADVAIDAAWSATFDWLTGWSRLPAAGRVAKQVGAASELLAELYADGLKFTQLAYKLQWAQSQARIETIHEKKLDANFKLLGGEPFWDNLKSAHKRYGDVLGVTAAKEAAPTVKLREPLAAFADALRGYVSAVAAHEDDDEPDMLEMAGRLLAPVKAWVTRARAAAPAVPVPTPPGGGGGDGGGDVGGADTADDGGSDGAAT